MSLQEHETAEVSTEYVIRGVQMNQLMQMRHLELRAEQLELRIKVMAEELASSTERTIMAMQQKATLEEQLKEFIDFTTRFFEAEDHARMTSAGKDRVAQLKAFDRLSVAETVLRSRLEQYHFLNEGV